MRRGGGKEPYRIPRRPVSGSANSGRSGGAKVHRINAAHTAAKQYFRDHPDEADKLEAAIRRDFHKLMSSQSKIAAKAAGRAVDVSADDFDDED